MVETDTIGIYSNLLNTMKGCVEKTLVGNYDENKIANLNVDELIESYEENRSLLDKAVNKTICKLEVPALVGLYGKSAYDCFLTLRQFRRIYNGEITLKRCLHLCLITDFVTISLAHNGFYDMFNKMVRRTSANGVAILFNKLKSEWDVLFRRETKNTDFLYKCLKYSLKTLRNSVKRLPLDFAIGEGLKSQYTVCKTLFKKKLRDRSVSKSVGPEGAADIGYGWQKTVPDSRKRPVFDVTRYPVSLKKGKRDDDDTNYRRSPLVEISENIPTLQSMINNNEDNEDTRVLDAWMIKIRRGELMKFYKGKLLWDERKLDADSAERGLGNYHDELRRARSFSNSIESIFGNSNCGENSGRSNQFANSASSSPSSILDGNDSDTSNEYASSKTSLDEYDSDSSNDYAFPKNSQDRNNSDTSNVSDSYASPRSHSDKDELDISGIYALPSSSSDESDSDIADRCASLSSIASDNDLTSPSNIDSYNDLASPGVVGSYNDLASPGDVGNSNDLASSDSCNDSELDSQRKIETDRINFASTPVLKKLARASDCELFSGGIPITSTLGQVCALKVKTGESKSSNTDSGIVTSFLLEKSCVGSLQSESVAGAFVDTKYEDVKILEKVCEVVEISSDDEGVELPVPREKCDVAVAKKVSESAQKCTLQGGSPSAFDVLMRKGLYKKRP